MQVTLVRITSTHNNVRTDETFGYAPALPTVGKRFVLYADPLDPFPAAALRMIITSPVVSIDGTRFITENSTYELRQEQETTA